MNEQNIKNLPLSSLAANEGQVEGLPRNPRFIRDARFDLLKKSISDAPEMLGMRTLIVFPHGGAYVVVCGNMRLRACEELGYAELPCWVLPGDTPAAKLREYAIKDNTPYGQTDWDIIAGEWDEAELSGWGMELPFPDGKWEQMGDIVGDFEAPSQDKGVRICVDIPYENAYQEREIRETVITALKEYNVTVK